MKIATVSNYINHHQIPLSDALYQTLGEDYHFIQTEPMDEERVKMGWGAMLSELPYLLRFYEEEKRCRQMILDSDIVIFGGVEDETYLEERLLAGKIVIRSSERIYKFGQWRAVSPRGLIKKYHDHTRYRKAPVYLLCDGGYVASDFHIIRAYPHKMFQWGYFPQTNFYDMEELMRGKQHKVTEIVWAGRFIKVKQPEYLVHLASHLKQDGVDAHMTVIGGGPLEEKIKAAIQAEGLQDKITLLGYKTPKEVRGYMEKANICLATSNYWEGWGAVINEAMNSGCAVIASHAMGATPFLIRDEENGLIYKNGDTSQLYEQVKRLLQDKSLQERLGREAYRTITELWNAEKAAENLVKLCKQLCEGKEFCFEDKGPISKAKVIAPMKMYHYLKKHKV